jgi:hypothetical protein
MQFKGTNFQSLTGFDLDVSGLTVIVGPSNKGKSAVFRALKGLFRNALPAEYIRSGSDGLSLTASLDGHIITATRAGKGSTQYKIDTKEFKKLNQTVPVELAAFGMNEVEVGDFTIDPIFARQHGKQFLVDSEGYSPMELNTILGAFASTEKLEAGKKVANLEITHKNSEAKTIAEEINASESRKASLAELDKNAGKLAGDLKSLEPVVQALEVKKAWLEAARARQAVLWPLQAALAKLSVPDMAEIARLRVAYDYAVQATNSFRLSRFYTRVREAGEFTGIEWLAVERLWRGAQALRALDAVLSSPVRSYVKQVRGIHDEVLLELEGTEPMVDGIIKLEQYRVSLDTVAAARQRLQALDADILKANAGVEEAMAEMVKRNEIECPKCGERFVLEEDANARTA